MSEKIICSMVNHGIGLTWNGVFTPCCSWDHKENKSLQFYWNNYQGYNDTVRPAILNDFNQGIRHVGCMKCFREEDLGYKSLRQFANEQHPQTHDTPSTDNPIYNFELRLGNNCNLKCIMCSPHASSSWHLEHTKHQEKFNKLGISAQAQPDKWWENPDFYNFLLTKFKDAMIIDISGGEPLPLLGTHKILDMLIHSGNTKLRLLFNTNLTRVPAVILEKLKLFSNVAFSVSLEGTGPMNDYLRYPSCWDEIDANLRHVQDVMPNLIGSVNHTLQHASVYSLPDLINYVKDRGIGLYMTTVYGNACLTPKSVPPEDLKKLGDWIKTQDWLLDNQYKHWGTGVYTIITAMCKTTQFDITLYEKYREYVSFLDSIRGTNYDATFNPSLIVLQDTV